MAMLKLIVNSNKGICRTPLTLSRLIGIRCLSMTSIKLQQKDQNELSSFMPNDPGDWKSIYKFPYIKGLASANKLKMYQVIFTAAAVPASFAFPDICDPLVVSW